MGTGFNSSVAGHVYASHSSYGKGQLGCVAGLLFFMPSDRDVMYRYPSTSSRASKFIIFFHLRECTRVRALILAYFSILI